MCSRNWKKALSALLVLALLVSFTACGAIQSSAKTKTIIDSAGDEVAVPNDVKTVVNLVTYGCQVMVGLGLGDYLIGIYEEAIESAWIAEMYPRINELEKYAWETSAEALLLAGADLVIVEDAEYARNLRSKGVTAITFTYYSIDEMKEAILMQGEILGENAMAQCQKYVAYLDANIALVSSQLEGTLPTRESLYYVNGVSNKGLYKTTGNGSTNWACAELSYTDFATETLLEAPANRVDKEAILAANPQNIIIGGAYQHVLYDELMSTPEWSNNYAVTNGNVFKIPMGIAAWNRYGLEIALLIPWTSAMVYPEYFEYDVLAETINFYKEFAGYTLTEQQAQYILDGLTPTGEKEIAN